jgi:hypothetical protein
LMRALPQRARRGLARKLFRAGTSNGQRVAIVLNERGVRCTMHALNFAQGDKTNPINLKINLTARIPILIDPDSPSGKPLTLIQSWMILHYFAQKDGKDRSRAVPMHAPGPINSSGTRPVIWPRLRRSVTAWGDRVGNGPACSEV